MYMHTCIHTLYTHTIHTYIRMYTYVRACVHVRACMCARVHVWPCLFAAVLWSDELTRTGTQSPSPGVHWGLNKLACHYQNPTPSQHHLQGSKGVNGTRGSHLYSNHRTRWIQMSRRKGVMHIASKSHIIFPTVPDDKLLTLSHGECFSFWWLKEMVTYLWRLYT